jgi:membrane dipeptidase
MDYSGSRYSQIDRDLVPFLKPMKQHLALAMPVVVSLLAVASYGQKKVSEAEVERVQKSALLIDTHNDVTSATVAGLDIGKARGDGHTDIPRMLAGGMGAQFFAVYVGPEYAKDKTSAHRTLEMIDTVRHDIIERYPETFVYATTADDIERAHRSGKIAALMGIEGGHAIEDSLRLLRDYYVLGIRYMTLTHVNSNNWADSSGDEKKPNNGLTEFGKRVVLEMNRLGMIVDISHVADKTFWDALAVSRAPIFASHSSCRALTNVPRNMTDEMMAALGKKGGVIQINFNCGFLSEKSAAADAAMGPEARKRFAEIEARYKTDPAGLLEARKKLEAEFAAKSVRATLQDVVDHIDHAVKIAGVEHVGLGSDFDGVECTPIGLEDTSKWPNLTRALLERGYSAEDIRKIYGFNTLRLMRAVEKTAAEMQRERVQPDATPIPLSGN